MSLGMDFPGVSAQQEGLFSEQHLLCSWEGTEAGQHNPEFSITVAMGNSPQKFEMDEG